MGRPRKNPIQEDTVEKKTVVDTVGEMVVEKKEENPQSKTVVQITDDDEVDVVSLNPNVSYYDKATDETYHWADVGEVISMPFGVIKNMWRNYKNYFRHFYLKPLDDRVIDKLGLGKTYEKYNFLTNCDSYTKENVDKIIKSLDGNTLAFKSAICNNIKAMIVDGKIADLYVIRTLGRYFDVDFIMLLD